MATSRKKPARQPSRTDAESAVRTLLAFIGEDPQRSGLKRTPARFLGAYEDWFAGYRVDPYELLGTGANQTFEQQLGEVRAILTGDAGD